MKEISFKLKIKNLILDKHEDVVEKWEAQTGERFSECPCQEIGFRLRYGKVVRVIKVLSLEEGRKSYDKAKKMYEDIEQIK